MPSSLKFMLGYHEMKSKLSKYYVFWVIIQLPLKVGSELQ